MEEKSHYHIETIKDHSFRLRHLPGGIFDMGDEVYGPIHKVELSPFYIGECPVTQALWKAVMGNEDNPSWFKGNDRPVENVSWIDIVEGSQDDDGRPAFLDRLNELTVNSRPSGHQYRLPTEAEWEYAARGGEPFLYSGSGQLKEVGWFSGNSHSETKDRRAKETKWNWAYVRYEWKCMGMVYGLGIPEPSMRIAEKKEL
jgi:sulfatase modifying factor 1